MRNCLTTTILIISGLLLLFACKTGKELVQEDYSSTKSVVYNNKTTMDSVLVYKHDSIFIRQKGDTVFKEVFKTIFKDRVSHDTLKLVDTLFVEKNTKTTIAVNETNDLQKMLMYAGIISIISVLVFVFVIIKLWQKK